MGVTRAILKQEINDLFNFLNQIKSKYDYGHPAPYIGKDIITTPIQTRMNHSVSAFINYDI